MSLKVRIVVKTYIFQPKPIPTDGFTLIIILKLVRISLHLLRIVTSVTPARLDTSICKRLTPSSTATSICMLQPDRLGPYHLQEGDHQFYVLDQLLISRPLYQSLPCLQV